jgi:protein-tyrosine phosphatase
MSEQTAAGVSLAGLVNFRDLGGLPVSAGGSIRPGVLFRSDSAAYATDSDADLLVDTLGLRTIVDLRDLPEIRELGRGPLADRDVAYLNVPLGDIGSAATRPEQYADMLRYKGVEIAEVIRLVSRPGVTPALIHCHIGCDRTGVVIAAILGLVGVPTADICADYGRSTKASAAIRVRARERRRVLGLAQMPDSYYDKWEPVAAVMAATIELVDQRWGGFTGWAAKYGLTAEDIAGLRSLLVA